MSTWKKIIVSGSDAHLSSVSASVSLGVNSNQRIGITQDLTRLTGSFTGSFVGNGSGLTNLNSDNLTLPTNAFGPIYSNDKFLVYNTGNGYVTLNDLLTQLAGTNLQNSGGTTLTLSSSIIGLTSVTSTGFTGSLQGTASYSSTSVSSSYATTASYVLNSVSSSFATTASYYAGGVSISNPTDNRVITSDGTSNGLNGEVHLTFDGSTLLVVGNVDAQSFTGSLKGTATTSSLAISSSYATTASYVLNSVSASFATTAASSSVSTTASYATNVQFPQNNVPGASGVTSFFINQDIGLDSSGNRNITWGDLLTDIAGTNLGTDGDSVNLNTTITGLTSVTSTSFTGSLQGTATTASYVLNGVSASFAQTASFVNPLRQIVQITGSLTTTGSNTLIGSTSLTGSLFITGSEDIVGYLGLQPVAGLAIPTDKSASYIYTSGSTNDLYFTQYQGPYTNTTRLRWLESTLYTGILHGGVLTSTPGSTQFSVTAGEGLVVTQNAFTGSAPYPTLKLVSWPTQTLPITNSGSAKITYVGINDSGTIVQQTVPWGSTDINQFDTEIELGLILHLSGSVSTGVYNAPQISYGQHQQMDDFVRAFGPLKITGNVLQASGSTLSIIKTAGTSYNQGSNYVNNPNHPSTVVEEAVNTSKIYRYYISGSTPIIDTGIANAGYTVIDPAQRVDTTTGTLTSVAINKYSLQRVFWVPNSPTNAFIVYYGNTEYASLVDAVNAKDSEPFSEAPNTAANAIFLGYIAVAGGATNLTNATDATIIPGGIFRSVGGVGATGTTPVSTTLSGLSDVDVISRTAGDLLYYNGSQWVNSKSLTGTYYITGSLIVGNTTIANGSITGSLFGSSSYATVALSSSFATNSSTASYVLNAVSSSFSTNSMTASYYGGTVTSASFASTASYFSGTVTSASFASTASFLSGGVTSASYAQTATTASYSSQEFVNVETLSADKTLTINDKPIQILTPNGANRNITLPTTGVPNGFKFEIWNKELYSESFYLYVNSSEKVDSNTKAIFRYDSSTTSYIKEYARNISIGGNNYGNYDTGVGVGYGAYNNYTGGVGIGGFALSNYGFGVGVGYGASSNREYGVGVGNDATSNYLYGVGIGASAIQNYSNGVGIGYNSYSNFNYAVGIGSDTTANSKGVGTVAIGAYTKAQRQNEFVTTGTNSVTNKAQSIIQKFRNIALATAAGAFQEIFTDASSGRLTIFASSIYQFRIQINAIEATGFKCKTWEITGGIKRNGSSVTTMVGGAPTYYITSEDSGTSNWDVRVTADDTNEALKIEVKHDSANNVTFSATVWATETRL